jgi:hypothetical protein
MSEWYRRESTKRQKYKNKVKYLGHLEAKENDSLSSICRVGPHLFHDMQKDIIEDKCNLQVVKFPPSVKPDSSVFSSQVPAASSYPNPDKPIPQPLTLYL